jgi:cell division protein FtsZ
MSDLLNNRPRIVVIGVGGAGGNAVNNMVAAGLSGVHFVAANTDTQALTTSRAPNRIQLGTKLTDGLGAGSNPEIGEAAAEEAIDEITAQIAGAHMVFVAAGMGGGTGTGAAYVVARAAKEMEILTIAVVTKPFQFEGAQRMRNAEAGIAALKQYVDTLLVIPNENLFRVATDRTTFSEAFVVADQVLYSGIGCLVDLIVQEGLINLDLADVRAVLSGMGTAMLGMGEASGEQRAIIAAEEAIVNPLLDNVTLKGAQSLLMSITGGRDLTLWEVDEAANRVREEVDPEANIIVGATLDPSLGDKLRVSIVASGMPAPPNEFPLQPPDTSIWTPRSQLAPPVASTTDHFGRRLTDAITERNTRGKGRSGGKAGGGRTRAGGPGDAAKIGGDGQATATEQLSGARTKGNGAAKRRAPPKAAARPPPVPRGMVHAESSPLERAAPMAVGGGGPVGWPEHWAKAGEANGGTHASPPPATNGGAGHSAPQEQPLARRPTFFERLAGLVGTKNAG